MKGPSGVDDILKTFEEARRNEIVEGMVGVQGAPQSQSAVNAAIDAQSMGSDDIGSMMGSQSGRRRGARRAPIGNTVSLNV